MKWQEGEKQAIKACNKAFDLSEHRKWKLGTGESVRKA